ncbi:hypothetical protein [Clostridium perfringens]|uniref:hypothetical protein n=1 Tax=Clostridium perfringens TaxID=1502 RepID=UPI0039E8C8F1
MYSVRDVAKALNISRQAVYKKLSMDSLKNYIVMVDGVKYLSEEGFQLLKTSCMKAKGITEDMSTDLTTVDSSLIETLNTVIVSKDRDIEYLKAENEKLLGVIQQQNQLLNNSQENHQKALNNTELLLLEKRQQLLLRESEYKLNIKKTFRERIRILIKGK